MARSSQEGLEPAKQAAQGQDRELNQQIEKLRKDMAELGSTVRELAQEQSAAAQRSFSQATDRLSRKGHQIAEDARAAGQQAVDYSSELAKERYDQFETTVRNNPTTSVLVALGLGYVAGLLSRNRK